MRSISAQAERALVWLEEAMEDSDKAREIIRYLAQKQGTNTRETVEYACSCLNELGFGMSG
jgi:hypothetical protein